MLNQNPVVLADKRTTPCRRRNSWHSCFNPKQLVAPQAEDQLLLPPAQPSPLANEGINGSGLRAPPVWQHSHLRKVGQETPNLRQTAPAFLKT